LDLCFLAGIDAEGVNVMSPSPQLGHKPLRLGRITSADANCIAALGKTPGDGRADGVACAYKYRYAAALRHSVSHLSSYLIL
jgi:hypothetical protein